LPGTVSFWRKSFFQKELVGAMCNLKKNQETLETISGPPDPPQQDVVQPVVEAPPLRRSERARHATDRLSLVIPGQHDILLLDNDEPSNCMEAMMGPKSEIWLGAMRSKMECMHDNQV
jgi:hypothetical protein